MMVWRVLKAALFISFMAPHSPVPAIEPNCEPFLDTMQSIEFDSLEKVELLQKMCHEMNGCYEELLGVMIVAVHWTNWLTGPVLSIGFDDRF
ncbi:Protein CBG26915 [Caenorhabditis briggsae]|uniref:Protein CBG26915 n=1 Tax=Caenorhabditis briggsae TaxID=6238 RepID=B6IEQ8_CAEBR|nr:Protein CBG26915 [Caenorhabditis briggsae]CAR98388.1 Protein CBG26915 [Caenorhabditis briggsae]